MSGLTRFIGLFIACITLAVPLQAAFAQPSDPLPWPRALWRDLARINAVSWRLREAAQDSCPAMASAIGVTFDSRRAYTQQDWPLLAATLGMEERPVIAAVAPGSPADRAGILAGDAVLAIAGVPASRIAGPDTPANIVSKTLADFVAALPSGEPASFQLERAGQALTVNVEPAKLCATRFELVTKDEVDAHSDGRDVAILGGLIVFTANDDELALVAGHELAHVIHRDGKASNLAMRRKMEDAADVTGAHLAKCAGYDAYKALDFWRRLNEHEPPSFLQIPTHRSPKKRIALITAALSGDRCAQATS